MNTFGVDFQIYCRDIPVSILEKGSSLPLTLGDFFSYDLYPVFKSLIGFHLIFYSFNNTSDSGMFFDAKLFPYMFQSVIPQMVHGSGKICIRGLKKEVIMTGHQTIGCDLNPQVA
jgi:hypothetical protein